MNFFTYGSLMFPDVWFRVAGAAFPTLDATLVDFAAWKISGESFPGMAPSPGRETTGVLHLDVTPDAASRLDAFEGAFYQRVEVEAQLANGDRLRAFAYVVAPTHRDKLEPVVWDAEEFRRDHLLAFLAKID